MKKGFIGKCRQDACAPRAVRFLLQCKLKREAIMREPKSNGRMKRSKQTTVGKYLIQRLEEAGLKHVFGIPGDYVLSFYDLLLESGIQIIGTCTELGAGFA